MGGQSRAAIRRVVRLGNAWHPVGANPASPLEPKELAIEVDYMHSVCERYERDPSELSIAIKAPIYDVEVVGDGGRRRFSGDSDQIIEDIIEYENTGVNHIILDTRSSNLQQFIEKMDWLSEEVIENFR